MPELGSDPCGACGACCRSYVVPLCGRDVWLISTQQRLDPEEFVVAFPMPKPSGDAFRLSGEGFPYGLALSKQGSFEPNRPCVFLLQLGASQSRCGIYRQRPVVCRSYPMMLFHDVVFQRKDSLCPPSSWSLADKLRPSWRDAIRSVERDFDIYAEVVHRWNTRIERAPSDTAYPLTAYLNYLLNVYDGIAALDARLGPRVLQQVAETWASMPPGGDLTDERIDRGLYPWITYLGLVREVVDRFFPEIEPLPSIVLQRAATIGAREPARHHLPDDLLAEQPV